MHVYIYLYMSQTRVLRRMFFLPLFTTTIIYLFIQNSLLNYIFIKHHNVVNCLSKRNPTIWNTILSEKTLSTNNKNVMRENNGSVRKRNKINSLFFLNLKKKKIPHLLAFHSEDCEYCNSMEPLLKKLKEEEGIEFLKLEMYENSYNFELLQQLDYNNLCGGLPYYYNLKTHYNICGATTYHNLRKWAFDKKCNPNEPPNEEI
ncbi:conserved Plasmodium protein, unknown function [Plasmodium chabaudi adami]|uniref:Thioredoxin-like protein n=1 Tax=Plasmodium chabaudi adami TaxID=5826 RepID=A0A1D3S1Y6_PLACE|nr:conserved Plasmodium protein, unknown function [Plasmodium chabaudi adami]